MQGVTLIFLLLFCGHVVFSMKLVPLWSHDMAMKAKGDTETLNEADIDDKDHNDSEDLSAAASINK